MQNEAVFLVNLYGNGVAYSLYSYRSYYLEATVEQDTENLLSIEAFSNWDKLDKYCDNIILLGPIY